jgi:hypothetical protein
MEGDPGECADSVYTSMLITGIGANAIDGLLILIPVKAPAWAWSQTGGSIPTVFPQNHGV